MVSIGYSSKNRENKRKRESEFKNKNCPDECMVCYERFPVSLRFPCGHDLCALCAESIIKICDNDNCPKCRAPLPHIFTEWLTMIKIYPLQLTPDIPLEKLQHAFPLICSAADLPTVIKCVQMNLDINTKGSFGMFPLALASLASMKNVVEYLLNQGADVNQPCNRGTALEVSCQMCDLPMVKYLIKKGAYVNQIQNGAAGNHLFRNSQGGHNPLLVSSQKGNLPIVQYLVKNGANVNLGRNDGLTPLIISSQQGHLQIVKYLIEQGADVNSQKK